jgi:predicted nucleic-acid-binding Zn-ribbon protein
MGKKVENILSSEKSLLNLGLVPSKTMKITTKRYYDFVCFKCVYENLSVTLGVEQRLSALRVGFSGEYLVRVNNQLDALF